MTPTPTPSETPEETPTPTPEETPEIPTIVIGVQKIWDDESDPGARPADVTFTLFADNTLMGYYKVTSDNWFFSLEVPEIGYDGHIIEYRWEEHGVLGYTSIMELL